VNGRIAETPQVDDTFLAGIQSEDFVEVRALEACPLLVLRALLVWVLEGKNQGQGRGFPFDQPYLVFYHRLTTAYTLLGECSQSGLFKSKKDKKLYSTVRYDLLSVTKDSALRKAAETMLEKLQVFNRLRAAMRITLPENKRALNDEGELCQMKTIDNEVTKFKRWLSRDGNRMKDKGYRKVIAQLDNYWEMLFCDPIVVQTDTGKLVIQPQRTNNILEQFFRNFMRRYRKKNGFQAMERMLKTMDEDTPLVMNLKSEDFMEVLLAGRSDLARRFAEIDPRIVRQEMNRSIEERKTVSARLKKVVNAPAFLETLTSLVAEKAS
jgi:hypothetical protein